MKFENSVMINQPIATVFDFVTDLKNNPQWQTDILELELTSEGRLELGSTYRCVNRFMGKRIETEGVITAYVPDRTCSFRIIAGSVTGESNFFFEAVDGATRFTTATELDLGLFKLGKIIVKRKINQQLKNDMLKLKHILENGKRAYPPSPGRGSAKNTDA